MKTKINFTIDEKLATWFKEFPNASEKANEIFTLAYENQANPINDFFEHKRLRDKEQCSMDILLPKIQQIYEEGDKKEREKADKILKAQREEDAIKKKKCEMIADILKEYGLFDEIFTCKDFNNLLVLNRKLTLTGAKNPLSKLGTFGAMLLMEVAEYHHHFITLGQSKEKQEEPEIKVQQVNPLDSSEELNPFELEASA